MRLCNLLKAEAAGTEKINREWALRKNDGS
jgi:hypothetical protein